MLYVFRVAFSRRDALRLGILRSLDVDAIRGARGGAQKAAYALFEPVFVALQDVNASIARLDRRCRLGEVLRRSFAEHRAQSYAEALDERHERFGDFSYDRWHGFSNLTLANSAPFRFEFFAPVFRD